MFRLVRTAGQEQVDFRNEHVDAMYQSLRNHPTYRTTRLVYIPENLPSAHGADIVYDTKGLPRTIVMNEFGADRRPGVPKKAETTNVMIPQLGRMFERNAVYYSEDLMTFDKSKKEQQIEQLEQELVAMEFIYAKSASNDPFQTNQGKWTGKFGPLGKDDGAVALAMAPYWSYMFMNSADPEYMAFISEANQGFGRRRAR